MSDSARQKNLQIITLHFNVPDHYLNLDDFISSARATEKILSDFNSNLFDGKLKYELVVLPPAPGTLKERLGIKVTTAAACVLLGAMGPEFTSGVIKSLTGKSVFELGQLVGESSLDLLDEVDKIWSKNLAAIFLSEAAKGFFQTYTDDLEKNGITRNKYSQAYQARNEFYESCYRSKEIKSIGFDDTDEFPIERRDFAKYIVEIPENKEDDNEIWEWEITYIKVVSPNWDRADINRAWKAKYTEKNEIKEAYFSIEDDNFWGLVDGENLTLKGKDSIKVQWAYIKEGSKRKKVRVLKVLEYNGAKLADPLSDEELTTFLAAHRKINKDQGDLFENSAVDRI